jgi:hypothetical protein
VTVLTALQRESDAGPDRRNPYVDQPERARLLNGIGDFALANLQHEGGEITPERYLAELERLEDHVRAAKASNDEFEAERTLEESDREGGS